jgi:hypothetical protein
LIVNLFPAVTNNEPPFKTNGQVAAGTGGKTMAKKLNTKKQNADICIICGADVSATLGYCSECEKRLSGKK